MKANCKFNLATPIHLKWCLILEHFSWITIHPSL
ncbi:hypothetical protein HNQ37_001159, partial [Lactovum miscens]|nr:hypothetical protein [Lactovum miscens]